MVEKSKSVEIRFELLENGLDFLLSGIDYIAKNRGKVDLKYGVLHTASGVELLLKERLRREHWSLLFRDPGEARHEAFRAGTFQSVAFEPCIERLEQICRVDFDTRDRRYLLTLRDKRNRLEHFGIVDKPEAIMGSLAKVLSILLNFINEELDPEEWEEPDKGALENIRRRLGEIVGFVEKRMKEIKSTLEKASTIFKCPLCLQEALEPDDRATCHFCGYSDMAEHVADEYIESVLGEIRYRVLKDGGVYPLHDCPECDRQTLVDTGISGGMHPADQYLCFACGNTWEEGSMTECSSCAKFYLYDPGGMIICDDCFNYKVSKDD